MTTIDDRPDVTAPTPPVKTTRGATPQVVVGAALVLIGALWLLERAGVIELTATTVLSVATIVVGLAIVILSWDGSHVGLVVFGVALAMVASASALAPLEGFQGGVGERVVEPATVGEIELDYNLAMGALTVDLTDLDELRENVSISASVGLGELMVRLPEGVEFEVLAKAGAGQIEILGETEEGLGVEHTYTSASFDEEAAGITLVLDVFMGRVEVSGG